METTGRPKSGWVRNRFSGRQIRYTWVCTFVVMAKFSQQYWWTDRWMVSGLPPHWNGTAHRDRYVSPHRSRPDTSLRHVI